MNSTAERLGVNALDILASSDSSSESALSWLSATVGMEHAIGFPSGRAAIRYALVDSGIENDDEVLVPAYSCYAVRSVVESVATPRFVDIDRSTFMLDLADAEEKTTDKTVAILPVHLYGNAVNMSLVSDFARKHGLIVIEDACQALGTAVRTDSIGMVSDYCTFSFSYYKDATAFAGGALLSHTELPNPTTVLPDLGWRVRLLAIAAVTRTLSTLPGRLYEPLRTRLLDPLSREESESLGEMNPGRLAMWEEGLLLEQFDELAERVESRRTNAKVYDECLPDEFQVPTRTDPHSYFRYPVLVPAGMRDNLCTEIRRRGIGCSTMYSYTLERGNDCPVAREVSNRILNLPVHAGLDEEAIREIATIVNDIWQHRLRTS